MLRQWICNGCAIFVSLYPGLYAKGADHGQHKTYNGVWGGSPSRESGRIARNEGEEVTCPFSYARGQKGKDLNATIFTRILHVLLGKIYGIDLCSRLELEDGWSGHKRSKCEARRVRREGQLATFSPARGSRTALLAASVGPYWLNSTQQEVRGSPADVDSVWSTSARVWCWRVSWVPGVGNPLSPFSGRLHPKPQLLLSQEPVKLRTANLANTFTGPSEQKSVKIGEKREHGHHTSPVGTGDVWCIINYHLYSDEALLEVKA